jgi:hypothetical protein
MTKHDTDPTPTDDLVTVTIPRSALQLVAPPPVYVHQGNVETVLGLERKSYMAACRNGTWPVTKQGKKYLARVTEVQAYLDRQAVVMTKKKRVRAAANEEGEDNFDALPLPKGVKRRAS